MYEGFVFGGRYGAVSVFLRKRLSSGGNVTAERTIGLYEIIYNWKGGENLCIDGDQLYIK